MVEDGILDGDLVGVKRTPEARDGQVAVARLYGELTIKRLSRTIDVLRLLPRNPAYAPIEVRAEQEFVIEGVFRGQNRRG
jgi:repressor LexA